MTVPVRVISQTDDVVLLGWDPPDWQEGYVTLTDGSDISPLDGKRHHSGRQDAGSVRIGKVKDGAQHQYGVRLLREGDSGYVTLPTGGGGGGFGADLRAAFPPLTGLPVTDDAGKPERTSAMYFTSGNSGHHYKNVRRRFGGDGYKFSNGAHDLRFDLCSAYDLLNTSLGMGWSFQPASGASGGSNNIQIYGGVNHNIGTTTRDHGGYFSADTRNMLRASVLDYDIYGYGSHAYSSYGGTCWNIVHTNYTAVNSRKRNAVFIGFGERHRFYNSILQGIWATAGEIGGSDVEFHNCCIYGGYPSTAQSGYKYIDCIFEDPDLDANFKPRNPKLLDGGLPGWVPEWDCRGVPYSRATIGAVAA